jgi:GxxExxY protein
MNLIYQDEFYRIKQACIKVRTILGNGFLEKVYENSLKHELIKDGFAIEQQKKLIVTYKGIIVGDYYADLVVDNKIIIEMKTAKKISDIHKLQILNYLKATGYKLGILINFPNNSKGFEIERIPNFLE